MGWEHIQGRPSGPPPYLAGPNAWGEPPCVCGHPGGSYHGRDAETTAPEAMAAREAAGRTPGGLFYCAGCGCREYRPQTVAVGAVMSEGDALAALGLDGWDCDNGGEVEPTCDTCGRTCDRVADDGDAWCGECGSCVADCEGYAGCSAATTGGAA